MTGVDESAQRFQAQLVESFRQLGLSEADAQLAAADAEAQRAYADAHSGLAFDRLTQKQARTQMREAGERAARRGNARQVGQGPSLQDLEEAQARAFGRPARQV